MDTNHMFIEGDLIFDISFKKFLGKKSQKILIPPQNNFSSQDSPKNFHTPPKKAKKFSYPYKMDLKIFIPPQHILHPPPTRQKKC